MSLRTAAGLGVGFLASASAMAAPPPPAAAIHVRGEIVSLKGTDLTVRAATGMVHVQLPAKPTVVSVVPAKRSDIKDGSFLGIASVPGAKGAQSAREVVVFPEAARGTGEGSYDWDLPAGKAMMTKGNGTSGSRMTNGTVSRTRMTNGTAGKSRMTNGTVHRAGAGGDTLTLAYKSGTGNGSQTITLPPGIPIVTFSGGQVAQLKPGAHVFVIGHRGAKGAVAADRVLVGKDGLVPPM